jgi:two-component system, OmpR family, sensor histidine kinase VicK
MELDDRRFGNPKPDAAGFSVEAEIRVKEVPRGSIRLVLSDEDDRGLIDMDFLFEAALAVGLALEAQDHMESLARSEEKYRKLSANLTKEMWARTEALARKTGYLEGILRSSDDIIITTDLDARIVEFNRGAERLLGFSAEEMLGRKVADLWERAEDRDAILRQMTLNEGVTNYETRLRTKSGELLDITLTLSVLRDAEGNVLGTVGVSKDHSLEAAMIRELENLNHNYRETIHFINHEFKNSLLVIGGFVRRLMDRETDNQKIEQLGIVYHHSTFLEAMTQDFLVMAELEQGEFQVRKQLIDNIYEEVVLPAMLGLKERYPDSFQSYDTSMGGVGAVKVYGDPKLLEIVFRNLFGNALKYRSPGGKIAYGVADTQDGHLFNVWNAGPGVPLDMTEIIFRKFYRAADDNTRDKRGTGLGLYNIRRIIEAHGGRIWCETDPDRSINFLFLLPHCDEGI